MRHLINLDSTTRIISCVGLSPPLSLCHDFSWLLDGLEAPRQTYRGGASPYQVTCLTAQPHIMNMTAYTMLPSSSDAVAMRCRSSDTTSLSGRAPRNQLSIRRSPLQLPHAHRRPLLNAAARSSHSPAERSQQSSQLQTPAAPLPRLNAVQMLQAHVPLWVLTAAPALAADADFAQGSASQGSYYATLFLFVSTIPGTTVV